MIIQGVNVSMLYRKAYNNTVIYLNSNKETLAGALKNLNDSVNKQLSKIDITRCTKKELEALGFIAWDESGLMLAPYHWLPLFKEGQLLTSISGDTFIVGKEKLDDDLRFGMLAYGIMPVKEGDISAKDKTRNV